MTNQLKASLFCLWTLACLASGWLLSDHWHKPVPIVATEHAQQSLGGGNILAARTLPQPDAKPATAVPAHSQPVAMAHVHIAARKPVYVDNRQPPDSHRIATAQPPVPTACADYVSHLSCPAVTVDETLVKDKTGQLDLVVKGDGIDQATLIPLQAPLIAPEHHWAAGLTYGTGRRYGAFVDRDAGPLRLGVEVGQAQGTGLEARVRVGWRF